VRRLGLCDLHFRMRETESAKNVEILNADDRLRGRRAVLWEPGEAAPMRRLAKHRTIYAHLLEAKPETCSVNCCYWVWAVSYVAECWAIR